MIKEELQAVLDSAPFHHFLKIEIVSIDIEEKRMVLRLPYRPDYQRQPETQQIHK